MRERKSQSRTQRDVEISIALKNIYIVRKILFFFVFFFKDIFFLLYRVDALF